MKAAPGRKAARDVYAVRQIVSDPGNAVQCQVTIASVKGGEFTVDVRAVGRSLKRVGDAAEREFRERFESVRRFMREQKDEETRERLARSTSGATSS